MDELDGQLIRVTLTCTSGGNSVSGCLTFTFYGTGSDISVSGNIHVHVHKILHNSNYACYACTCIVILLCVIIILR